VLRVSKRGSLCQALFPAFPLDRADTRADAVAMNAPPPLYRDQRAVDRQHLSLLTIFHYVVAGFSFLGLAFLFLHYTVMSSVFNNPEMWQNSPSPPPPQLFAVFKWFYAFGAVFLILAGVANLLSGLFLRARKHRIFSIVVSACNCLQVPFGTVLGIFTIVVLVRESVRELYEHPGTDESA
jgi:hypothetical protein